MGRHVLGENNDRVTAQDAVRTQPTVRSRLLLAVNLPMALLVAVFLAYDYSWELARRLEEKRIALEEEAKTMLPAVLQMQHHGATSVQQYIDTVCGRMQGSDSPGHHIAVELDGTTYQAVAHRRASPGIMKAMRAAARAPKRGATFGETNLIVGFQEGDGAAVYVSESLENLRGSVLGELLRRLLGFALLAAVAAVVVNVVLARVVSKPLDRLIGTVQEIGAGRFGAAAKSFSTAELNYLAGEINAMSSSLAAANRYREAQMAKARDIQQHLLPHNVDTPGINVAHLFKTADDVGGDYYDVLPLDGGAWLFCVADVTGHGVPAALTAAMLKTLLLQAVDQCTSLPEMMSFINRRLTEVSLVGDFVTMALLRADPRTGSLKYASAGHEPAWLLAHSCQVRELSSTGLILGIDSEAAWEETAVDTAAGDRLLIVTDGVSETINREGKMFGRARLARLLAECVDLSVDGTVGRMNEALEDFRGDAAQSDDVTLVLVEMDDCI